MLKGFVFDYDTKTGKVELRRTVDLSAFLYSNYQERKLIGRGFSKGGNLRKIGSIPVDVLIKHGIDIHDDNAIRKFLREHPEYRCSEGAI
jgi:hypothetical protein